jgi:hypothetical protein
MRLAAFLARGARRAISPPFCPASFLGQWLEIGKETVFGPGRYEIADDVL